MLYWRRLQCNSNTLHINLFLAFIMRASMSFMKDRLFVGGLGLPQDVRETEGGTLTFIHDGTHWECRTLYVLFMFAISASQVWFLMEGLYLYLLVHRTMATGRLGVRPYMIFGWALPWTFLIPWVVVKAVYENTFCWNVQENPSYFWILKGPWTAIVVINFFFFLDIIRVLILRVRDNQRHVGRSQFRKFGKFILVLIPLFGIMYIVLFVAFPSGFHDNHFDVVYLYIEMGYNSFQGFILALLFCFLNDDVQSELRRSWQRHRSRRENTSMFKRSANNQSSWGKTSRTSLHQSYISNNNEDCAFPSRQLLTTSTPTTSATTNSKAATCAPIRPPQKIRANYTSTSPLTYSSVLEGNSASQEQLSLYNRQNKKPKSAKHSQRSSETKMLQSPKGAELITKNGTRLFYHSVGSRPKLASSPLAYSEYPLATASANQATGPGENASAIRTSFD